MYYIAGYTEEDCVTCPGWNDDFPLTGNETVCTHINSDCICRNIGETCGPGDFGVMYHIFLAVVFFGQSYNFWKSYEVFVFVKKSKKPFTVVDKVLLLNALGIFCRMIWAILLLPGRRADKVLISNTLAEILLKVPHICWFIVAFYYWQIWKQLVDQVVAMKKTDPAVSARINRKVFYFGVFSFLVVIPAQMLGLLFNNNILFTIVNLYSAVCLITLAIGGYKFGRSIGKTLKTTASGKDVGAMIQYVVYSNTTAGTMMILGILIWSFGLNKTGPWATYIFWLSVHISEIFGAGGFLSTKRAQIRVAKGGSYESKASKMFRFSTNKSNKAGVTSLAMINSAMSTQSVSGKISSVSVVNPEPSETELTEAAKSSGD